MKPILQLDVHCVRLALCQLMGYVRSLLAQYKVRSLMEQLVIALTDIMSMMIKLPVFDAQAIVMIAELQGARNA